MFKLFDPVWECVFYLDLSCKFSKLQYNSLAFVAGFKRATDEGSLPKITQYCPYYLPLNVFTASRGSNRHILFIFCCDTTVFVLCFGVEYLCYLNLTYFFIFLFKDLAPERAILVPLFIRLMTPNYP